MEVCAYTTVDPVLGLIHVSIEINVKRYMQGETRLMMPNQVVCGVVWCDSSLLGLTQRESNALGLALGGLRRWQQTRSLVAARRSCSI